jgi:transcription-repair coupling factor (superfamily II helicase)
MAAPAMTISTVFMGWTLSRAPIPRTLNTELALNRVQRHAIMAVCPASRALHASTVLRALEFDRIREALAREAATLSAANAC